MTDHALQEDMVASARRFLSRGQDVLHKRQTFHDLPDEAAQVAILRECGGNERPLPRSKLNESPGNSFKCPHLGIQFSDRPNHPVFTPPPPGARGETKMPFP